MGAAQLIIALRAIENCGRYVYMGLYILEKRRNNCDQCVWVNIVVCPFDMVPTVLGPAAWERKHCPTMDLLPTQDQSIAAIAPSYKNCTRLLLLFRLLKYKPKSNL
jgi:hypothetical protein